LTIHELAESGIIVLAIFVALHINFVLAYATGIVLFVLCKKLNGGDLVAPGCRG